MRPQDDPGWDRALYRWAVVSQVQSLVLGGLSLAQAVARASRQSYPDPSGDMRPARRSSIYRWLAAYGKDGLGGLFDAKRESQGTSLPPDFLAFLVAEKKADPEASVPDVIAKALEMRIIASALDRTTVYRAARRLNLPLLRKESADESDKRPFAYPHRMQMMLVDGKYFRAGAERLKRLAFFFLDDATRVVLDVFVTTAGESAEFFLRSLFEVMKTFGFMGACYLDRGPGFRADDTRRLFAALGIPLILGAAGYPEGRGKIERFNRTVARQLLRSLGKPGIDPAPRALELRIRHYLRERYNRHEHTGIKGVPQERFDKDEKPLRFPKSEAELRKAFVLTDTRKVREDNVVAWNDVPHEVPLGYAGTRVTVYRDLVSQDIQMLHQGKLITLKPANLAQNARERRGKKSRQKAPQPAPRAPITTAAEIHFNRDFSPIVGADGGFPEQPE
jgi:putative transposase